MHLSTFKAHQPHADASLESFPSSPPVNKREKRGAALVGGGGGNTRREDDLFYGDVRIQRYLFGAGCFDSERTKLRLPGEKKPNKNPPNHADAANG